MLSLLHIENIAVIEQADISFDKGFNVLTGETGAGKSIVIDAISAILGQRAYRDMIRTGTSKASVRAVFTKVPNFPWFEENGVEYDEETVIQRDIFLDGKNVCRVNGTLVTARFMTFLGTVAAGGKGVEPYLVASVERGGEAVYTASAQSTGRIMGEETAKKLQQYLRNNVQTIYGDGNFPGLSVCAKSGTSQLGGGQKSNAMFAGFVMDESYPLAFIVVVENGGYGSATCVPVLSQVLQACKTELDSRG